MTQEDMPPGDLTGLRALVRKHRVYLEVAPVTVTAAGLRVTVALDVKLWGAHPRTSAPIPGCPKCLAILDGLQAVASSVLPRDAGDARVEMLPFDRLLYVSDKWGRDEIDLTIRVSAPQGAPAGAPQERALRGLCARLEALGVYEGGWRPSDPR